MSGTSDSFAPPAAGSEKGEGEAAAHASEEKAEGVPEGFEPRSFPPASGSVTSEGDAAPHRSEEKSEDQRTRTRKIDKAEESVVLVTQQQANQAEKTSAATVGEGSGASAAALHHPRPRYPPYPKGGKTKDVREWMKECRKVNEMIRELDDLDYDIPTMMAPKDPGTSKAVQSSKDKVVVLRAARSIVSVAYITDDGQKLPRCTGIIIKQWSDAPGHHHAIIVTCSRVLCKGGKKHDPLPKLSVTLPDKKTILDAELINFNDHYEIALLNISLDFALELPSIGRGAEYGQEVFVLARAGGASLRVRRGNVKWLEESGLLGRDYYMFLSCDIPEGGNGGMVIDNNGEIRGMAVYWSPYPAVISISTIVTCVDMFMQFNRVARPVLGFSLRTIALLDVQLQEDISDIGIDGGFVVDEVFYYYAEKLGIKCGNVIISINGQDALTLPELEDYLLSLGWDYLKDESICMKDLKLRVCDLKSGVKRDVALPVTFYDKAERVSPNLPL
ncbi:unnamed protein product [Urochloa decumbens]|uniref:Uncharacterized protein n=1 Tax=Urochloa decumbens TaxID=240449 RepID=A0ABC9D0N9_9POAL